MQALMGVVANERGSSIFDQVAHVMISILT